MLWQLRCHCNPDHDKFSSTVVAIFPNVCLWRRSLCSNLVLTLKNCIEPPSYASTAYVVAIWPSFLFDSFVKIWDTCENFLGKWFTAPPGKKFPVRLRSQTYTLRNDMNSSHFALIRNANLLKCSSRHVLQHLWPHFVCIGSFSGRWQIEHCKSSSTAFTNSSSYPPNNGASSTFGKFGTVREWKEKPLRRRRLKAILGGPMKLGKL